MVIRDWIKMLFFFGYMIIDLVFFVVFIWSIEINIIKGENKNIEGMFFVW